MNSFLKGKRRVESRDPSAPPMRSSLVPTGLAPEAPNGENPAPRDADEGDESGGGAEEEEFG